MNVKTSLNLAYKIVNYVLDSEISQTAGAKEYKPTQGVGRGGKKYSQTIQEDIYTQPLPQEQLWHLHSGSPTSTKLASRLFPGFDVQTLDWKWFFPLGKLGHKVCGHQRERTKPELKRMCTHRLWKRKTLTLRSVLLIFLFLFSKYVNSLTVLVEASTEPPGAWYLISSHIHTPALTTYSARSLLSQDSIPNLGEAPASHTHNCSEYSHQYSQWQGKSPNTKPDTSR